MIPADDRPRRVRRAAERLHHIGNRLAVAVIWPGDRRMMGGDKQARAQIQKGEHRPRRHAVERPQRAQRGARSEEHTSELQSLMRISYAVFCLKKKKKNTQRNHTKINRREYTYSKNTRQ